MVSNRVYFSPEWKRQIGYEDHEIESGYDEWESRLHPDDHAPTLQALRGFVAGERPEYAVEFRLRHKDGSWRWIMTRADLIRDPDGRPIRMMGCHIDISERKRAESALSESELRMRIVTDNARVGLVMVSDERRYLFANATYSEILNLPAGDLIGRRVSDVLAAVYEQQIRPRLDRAFAGERVAYELQLPATEGNRCFAVAYEPRKTNDTVSHVVVVLVDITARKEAETALREREQQLRLFVEHSPAAIAMLDRDLRYLVASHRWLADYRLGDESVVGRSHYDLFPEIPERWKEIHRRCLAGAIEKCEEDPFPREDGTIDWVRWEIRPWHTAQGDVGGLIIFSERINERKQAEARLIESQQRLALATDSAHIGIWDWDVVTNKLVWDANMYKLYGIQPLDFGGAYEAWEAGVHPEDRKHAADETFAVLGSRGGDYHTEFRIVWPNGEVRHIEAHGVVQRAGNGSALRMLGTNWDITDRKRAESALRESEGRLRLALTSAAAGSWTWEADAGVSAWDERFHALYGFTADQPPSFDAWIGRLHPEDRPRILARLDQMRTTVGDDRWDEEFRSVLPGGAVRWHNGLGLVERDATGAIRQMVGIDIDVTERKQAEEALRESEANYRTVIECASDGIFVTDAQGRYLDANTAGCRMLGYTREELLGLSVPDIVAPAQQARVAPELATLTVAETNRQEWQFRRKDGTLFLGEGSGTRLPDGRLLGILHDITERKRAESALRASEEKLKLAMRAAKMGTWLFDFQTGQFEPDAAAKLLHELEADEAIVTLDQGDRHIHPDDVAQMQRRFEQALQTKGTYENEYRVMLPDGQTRWIYSLGRVSDDARYLIGTVQDITERKQVEEALRESEQHLRQLFDVSPDALFITDAAGHFLDANQTAVTRYGYCREELLQLSPRDLTAADLKEQAASRVRDAIERGTHFEWWHRRKDGSEFPVEIITQPLSLNGQPAFLGCVRDVSLRKQAEEAARDSQAMLQLIHDSIPQGVFWKDRNSVYRGTNRVCWQAMGFASAQQVVGLTDFDVPSFRREQTEFFIRKDREVMDSDQPEYGIIEPMTLSNGETIWLETNKIPMHDADGNVTGILGTWQDITERQQANEELRISRERLEILSRQLIATQESERRHLARELHDEIGQALTAIKLNLNPLQQTTTAGPLSEVIHNTIDVVDQTLHQVRNLALDLRPSMLDDIGLVAALSWCLDRQSQRAGFVPHFVVDPSLRGASQEIETACFRIAQESLTNIARHAKARNVHMELRQLESELELFIQDDGIGFDVPAARLRAWRVKNVRRHLIKALRGFGGLALVWLRDTCGAAARSACWENA
ncbi:MAG: PAS domain S-box protein, partial [Planctomycetaceae bacterium]